MSRLVGMGLAGALVAVPLAAGLQSPTLRPDAWFLPDEPLLGFVEIPEGPFSMGGDRSVDPLAYDIEAWGNRPGPGTVAVPTFYIGRYEVTVAQYRAFVRETGYRGVDEGALAGPPDHPVSAVSWTDALAYARWLQGKLSPWDGTPGELRERFDGGWRVSLPSEAQWEKAARGGDGRTYPWGDRPSRDRANYQSGSTTPVGMFPCPECPFGLSDMSGNVWEWTRSPYQPYPYDESDDRDNLTADAMWVMRGGSFVDGERDVRAATRGGAEPGARRPFIGFRLVLSKF